ncbi:hypothetical protein AAFF_G00399170 [Aldrovandia affinis]|uniref:Uncharacterized protein n=1 Tax=Aldrovandia affinis TaxID=143900 RepID=A0AAD7SD54_9TELE|nr:hypothetical protein AAFF_G00399170 [Aldrovandia affinis]
MFRGKKVLCNHQHDAKDQFSSVGLSFRCRGLWSECLLDNMAHIWTCDIPLSYLGDLPAGIVATRVSIVVTCGVCVLAILMQIFGMQCTKLVSATRGQKDKLIHGSCALFLCGGQY